MLQVSGYRREVLERLERLFTSLRITRAQARSENLLEQVCLAVGGERTPLVAPTHPVARELGHSADDSRSVSSKYRTPARCSPLTTPYSSSSCTSFASALVSSNTSSTEYSRPWPRAHSRWSATVASRRVRRDQEPGGLPARPAASSWRITPTAGTVACIRRIVRRRATSPACTADSRRGAPGVSSF